MKIYIASSLLVAILGSIISEALGCSDLHPTEKCEELKQDGRCDKWQMMRDRCQATCGFCKYPSNRSKVVHYFQKINLFVGIGFHYPYYNYFDVYF